MNDKPTKKLSRVSSELSDMYHQLLLGTLLGTILRVAIDVAGISLIVVGTYFAMEAIYPASQCANNAFIGEPKSSCWLSISLVSRVIILLIAMSIGSFFSTKFKKSQKFQHSTSVTGGLLIIATFCLIANSYPLSVVTISFFAIFTATYIGYRLWFSLRDRLK